MDMMGLRLGAIVEAYSPRNISDEEARMIGKQTTVEKDGFRIVVTRRYKDYHACLEDQTSTWGCGKTIDEAVESFLRNKRSNP